MLDNYDIAIVLVNWWWHVLLTACHVNGLNEGNVLN